MSDIKVRIPWPAIGDPTQIVLLTLHDSGDGTFAPVINAVGISAATGKSAGGGKKAAAFIAQDATTAADGKAAIVSAGSSGTTAQVFTADGTYGTWQDVVGALQTVTTPPVSGTVYQNTSGRPLHASLTVTLSPTSVAAATVVIAIGSDSTVGTTWATVSEPIGALQIVSSQEQIAFTLPVNWFYKVTATNATPGALVALG
jgi:hypothetical protein